MSINAFTLPFKIARRELRTGMRGFYVFLLCLILGVTSITAVKSVSRGLIDNLRHDGRYILGGDLALRTIYKPATDEQIKFMRQEMGPTTIVLETRAMARNKNESQATMVELKAVDPFYPLYGKMKFTNENGDDLGSQTQDFLLPTNLQSDGSADTPWGVAVDRDLLKRLKAKVGDDIHIGKMTFKINAIIDHEPDKIGTIRYSFAPRVMMSSVIFPKTGLSDFGSQVYYEHKILMPYVKTLDDLKVAQDKIKNAFPDATWEGRSFVNASPAIENFINRLSIFLSFVGLSALLVGGVGVSNAVKSFMDTRLATIATFKSLGAQSSLITKIYLIQIGILASLGIAVGLALGTLLPYIAMPILAEQLSLTGQFYLYPDLMMQSALFGYVTCFAFSLWPIGRACQIKISALFRDHITNQAGKPNWKFIFAIFILIEAFATLIFLTTPNQKLALGFIIGASAAFIIFVIFSKLIQMILKKMPHISSPDLRMSIASLYRPGNVTTGIILSIGLGLCVLVAIFQIESHFRQLVAKNIDDEIPAFFFLDIQPDQRDAFEVAIDEANATKNLIMTPSLRGRITKYNGTAAKEAIVDHSEDWILNTDRGFTYTATQPAHSRVTAGKWWDKSDYEQSDMPLISVATDVQKAFDAKIGDTITVTILGRDITAKIFNVREIDWGSFTMNFAVTFAPGALENAPATTLATVQVTEEAEEENLQNILAQKFPNVTSIRVREALELANNIMRGVATAVQISALVTIISGILVLAGGISAGHRSRLYDAVILKTLGLTRGRIMKLYLVEYGFLGLMTSMIAGFIGCFAAWALLTQFMEMKYHIIWDNLIWISLSCLTVTILLGLIGTWHALGQKPAPLLRNE